MFRLMDEPSKIKVEDFFEFIYKLKNTRTHLMMQFISNTLLFAISRYLILNKNKLYLTTEDIRLLKETNECQIQNDNLCKLLNELRNKHIDLNNEIEKGKNNINKLENELIYREKRINELIKINEELNNYQSNSNKILKKENNDKNLVNEYDFFVDLLTKYVVNNNYYEIVLNYYLNIENNNDFENIDYSRINIKEYYFIRKLLNNQKINKRNITIDPGNLKNYYKIHNYKKYQ